MVTIITTQSIDCYHNRCVSYFVAKKVGENRIKIGFNTEHFRHFILVKRQSNTVSNCLIPENYYNP
jgi:hypothetical protein